jgi:hypothetical protein
VKIVLSHLPENVKVMFESDSTKPANVDGKMVRFNGVDEKGHETFLLSKTPSSFEFCKTARKPYDLAVCAVLMLASYYAESGEISSDGINAAWNIGGNQYPDNLDSEWKDAWEFLHGLFYSRDKEDIFKNFANREMICRMI